MIRRFLCRWFSLHEFGGKAIADAIGCCDLKECLHCGCRAEVAWHTRKVKILDDMDEAR